MPTPILKIPVDDSAFKRFLETFKKFQDSVKAQPEAWKDVNDGMAAAMASGAAFAAEIAHQAEETRRLAKEEADRDKALQAAARRRKQEDDEARKREEEAAERRKKMVDQAREFGRTITNNALSMTKWSVGLLGLPLAGLWGLEKLVSGVADDRRAAMGLGVSMGQRQGMGIQMQRYFDVNSVLENVANAQANPSQWGAFRMMGVDPSKGNAADTTYQLAVAARRMFRADHGNLALAQAQGLTQFFAPDDLRRMAAESNGQFNASIRQSRAYQGLSDEVGRKWQNFMVNLDTAGKKLENTLIDKLTVLERNGDLDKIISKFGDLAVQVLDRIDFNALGDGMDTFTKYITSPKFQSDFKTFVDDVGILAHKMVVALKWLGLIPDGSGDTPDGAPNGAAGWNGKDATKGAVGGALVGGLLGGVPGAALGGLLGSSIGWHPAAKVGSTRYATQSVDWGAGMLRKWGWNDAQSRGILSNLVEESSMNPFAVGDKGSAYGIAQWHADRQAQYAKLFGHTMQSVKDPARALDEQLKFVQWELTHTFKKAGDHLRATNSAYSAGGLVSDEYERPYWKTANHIRRGVGAVTLTIKNQTGASIATSTNTASGG